MMLFFTVTTLIDAITNKVTDCGCFGDAVKLKPEGGTIRAEIDAPWEPIRRFLGTHLKHATLLAPAWRRAQMREELLSALSTYPQE